MALFGKLEADTIIKVSADKIHDIFGNRPYHLFNISPNLIQGVDLLEGEWGKEGSKICWRLHHDGKSFVAKEMIEKIDHENNSIACRVIEGDLLEIYKSLTSTVQAIPNDEGCVVRWTVEYEKLHDGVGHPDSFLQFLVELTKEIEAHLIKTKE